MRRVLRIAQLSFLGFIIFVSPAFASKKDNLASSTMGESISGFLNYGIQSRRSFDKTSREIIWFGRFKLLSANQAKLFVEWITPAGEVFKKDSFSTQISNCDFGWTKLDIKGKDAAALDLEGDWSVKIFWDEDLIDTQKFYMGERKFSKVPVPEPMTIDTEAMATAEGYIRLAKAYYAKDQFDKAIDALLRAETLEPDSPAAYLILGNLYNATGRPEDAILQFSKAQSLKADEIAVRRGFATAYIKLNLIPDAIKEYELIVKLRLDSKEDLDKLTNLKKKIAASYK